MPPYTHSNNEDLNDLSFHSTEEMDPAAKFLEELIEKRQCDEKHLKLKVLGIFGQEWEEGDGEDEESYISMRRYRLKNKSDLEEGEEWERAYFKPAQGLAGHELYHNDPEENGLDEPIADRAILFQSFENYETVAKDPRFKPYFHLSDEEIEVIVEGILCNTDRDKLRQRILEDTRFGEQIIVKGFTPKEACLGDIFEASDGELRVQVTCPRKPCYYLDKKNFTPMGSKGAKRFTIDTALAGWFTRVLREGELKDGMTLTRTHQPYPHWNLGKLAKAVYGGEGNAMAVLRGAASWGRSKADLQDLIDATELCEEEWKEELVELMKEMAEQDESSCDPKDQEELQASFMDYFFNRLFALCGDLCSPCHHGNLNWPQPLSRKIPL